MYIILNEYNNIKIHGKLDVIKQSKKKDIPIKTLLRNLEKPEEDVDLTDGETDEEIW